MKIKDKFLQVGFTQLESLITMGEVEKLRVLYDDLLNDAERTKGLRSDLSGASDSSVEKITQIMRPSLIEPDLAQTNVFKIALNYAKQLLGDDMSLDFDMLINKAPHTNTETPWHQDAAYWIKMPDKRSVSCWIALDDVYEDNGCMWFIPKTESVDVLKHYPMPNKGALYCETDTSESQCVPLKSGGCTFHDGFTLHFSKGNKTESQRRALILNFRPEKMIKLEREQGVDHTGDREIRNKK